MLLHTALKMVTPNQKVSGLILDKCLKFEDDISERSYDPETKFDLCDLSRVSLLGINVDIPEQNVMTVSLS